MGLGSELVATSSKKSSRKRDRALAEADVIEQDAPMGEQVVKQDSKDLPGGSEHGAKPSKKKERKRDRVAGELEIANEDAAMGELDAKQEYSDGLPGGSELDAESRKKRKRKRNCEGGAAAVTIESAAMCELLGKQECSNGLPGSSELGAKSSKEKKRERDRVVGEPDISVEDAAMGQHVVKRGYTNGLRGGSELGAESSKKRKRKRNGIGDIGNELSIISGFDTQTDGMAKKKEKSKTKKTVRFQEPTTPEFHEENVTYMPCENDIDEDMAWLHQGRSWDKDVVRKGLRYGRFTIEEDEKIKDSVFKYIKMSGWDEKEGLQRILHSSVHREARGCWIEIAKCLPIRPVKQINSRAIRLLGGFTHGVWSADEITTLKDLHDKHGSDWKWISQHLNRSGQLCKDKWRKLRLADVLKKGFWTQDEMDRLCGLVRRSLIIQASLPAKKLDRREGIRDDLNWEWIGEEMQRHSSTCATLWYERMASPMIRAKKWANGDDRVFLQRLIELGAQSEEVVDWDEILDHRDGECCMQRWKEMTRVLGKDNNIPFEDKVELLTKRYAPDLLGVEESKVTVCG